MRVEADIGSTAGQCARRSGTTARRVVSCRHFTLAIRTIGVMIRVKAGHWRIKRICGFHVLNYGAQQSIVKSCIIMV